MSGNAYIFQRIEKKYMLTKEQYESFITAIEPYMAIDKYGLSKICAPHLTGKVIFDQLVDRVVTLHAADGLNLLL